ncbi:ShlB/FhaC/HecB family hemolysin secretion/activation protein [Acaryochloris thomasi]|uniref:ShlB/FhaC/HecB family hemolysin secretion/activation protein n=1 Tax=Acaryochloris thomasi TaxID=2929456 RepID=UPI001F3D1BB2|nr:ShlB/FhaC/HecB family hemolysin secretion/activation protein [Acaryochloris thomasi]
MLGATVLQEEIEAEVQALENQTVTLEQLLDLRTRIAKLYNDNGYITSGAFLPSNQNLSDGIIQIQVVEGQLEEIQIIGLKRLRKKYVRRRISPAAKVPLNQAELEKKLQLLQLNPLLKRVNAELTVGSSPGLNTLLVNVEQAREFHVGASIDNYRSPAIGSIQGSLNLAHDNFLGLGDRITAATSITAGLNLYDLGYTVPINARDGTIGVRYSNAASEIVASELRPLDISNDFESLSLELRQPVVKTPNTEIALGLSFDLQQNQSFLADQPFPFSQGPDADGIAKTRVLRFSQEWTQRQPRNVVALRSQFNLGVDVFDATVNVEGPSANFFSWVGQAQYVQRLPLRALLISRLSTQLTPDSLLNQERFGIGGISSVRGYASNQLLTDNGILGTVECQFPLTSNPNVLQLSPFIDAGKGWNNFGADPSPSALVGIGVGLRWQPIPDLSLRFDYGLPIVDLDDRGNSLQEQGFYFSLQYQPL